MVSIVTWNVNSVRTRLVQLTDWLREDKPDIVLLQEIKCMDEAFPALEIESLGYNIALFGQKSYNGVAILSKYPLEDVSRGLPGDESDVHARYIEAVTTTSIGVIRVASVYVPNGQTPDSDKFIYKLGFLERLYAHLKQRMEYDEMFVIGGDYNIAPTDEDVAYPAEWKGTVLTHDKVRAAFRKLLYLGLYDAGASKPSAYSWWDYRAGALEKNDGLRIDHLLVSPQIRDKLSSTHVETKLRALEKPSDHAPVMGIFE